MTFRSTLQAIYVTMRPLTIVLAIMSTYLGGLIAGASLLDFSLLLGVIAVASMTAGSTAFNDYLDRDIDAISHPYRPIPQGKINPYALLGLGLFLFGIGITLSLFINILCFLIVTFTFTFLLAYEFYFKNIGFVGNLTVASLSALSFTYGGAAVGNPLASVLFSLITFFLFIAIEVFKDVHDVKGDLLSRNTLPMKIGEKNAAILAGISLLITVSITPLPYFFLGFGLHYLALILVVDFLWVLSIVYVLRDIQRTGQSILLIRRAAALAVFAILIGVIL